MSQRLTNSFINTNVPGSYFDAKVKSTPVGVASSGNIVIIGEATGGAKYTDEVLKDNWFTPDQLDKVIKKYISGPIVEGFRAVSSPSADADITGSANRIYIVKTNTSTQASATIATAYGTLTDKNYGLNGNKYSYQISEVYAEVAPSVESDAISAFGAALDGASFTVRLQGGAATVITLGTGGHADRDALVTEIDGLLPAGLSCLAGTDAAAIKIEMDADASANSKGYGKDFELVDSTPGDLAALGLTEGLLTSSQEPDVQIDIVRSDISLNETFEIAADIAFEIGYEGTTATMDITSTALTTTVTGGSGANLSITLADFATLKDLATFIGTQTGYTASVVSASATLPTSALDKVTTLGICSTSADLKPGRVKKSIYNFSKYVGQSVALDFAATATAGLPDVMTTQAFLSGGATGATLSADVASAVLKLETIDVNFVIPLFSRDASADIADGLTDSSSTYTISAVNALVKNHVLKMSTAKIRKHRLAVVSIWDTYSNIKVEASAMGIYRIPVVFQKSTQVNVNGVIESFFPWHTACIAAGMQAAGFYKGLVNKQANVVSFEDPSGFDSGSYGDIEDAIDSGLLFLEKQTAGNFWVSDQTSYTIDTNFVYNSLQASYASDLIALDLSASFKTAFSGKSLADVDAATGLSFLASKMDSYKKQKLIVASDDAPLGYKNAKIQISGPIMDLSVEIKIGTLIYFIPISIDFSQVVSTAQ